jgi:heme oxygenase (mycobilin-producing)
MCFLFLRDQLEQMMKFSTLLLSLVGATIMATSALAQSSRDIVLISPMDVKPGKETECIASWDKAVMVMREKPGFKSARLHRSNMTDGRGNMVTVGVWSNFEQFEAASADPQFRAAFSNDICTPNSTPYRAVRDIRGRSGVPTTPTDPFQSQSR